MVIYISGKITGTVDYAERFRIAGMRLKKNGYTVVNPAEIGDMLDEMVPFELSHDEYMAIDLQLLKRCDAIYMLKGFENSDGARMERMKAIAWGKKIFYEEDGLQY